MSITCYLFYTIRYSSW